jgi:uncharacterized protein
MKTTDCRLIVFAKAPIPGQVKTRLFPSLGKNAAAVLYEQMIWHCLNTAVEAKIGPVDLWYAPSTGHSFFDCCAEQFQLKLYRQTEGDLGRRMSHALNATLSRCSYALLIGTDCPSLTCADLREAADVLRNGVDAVIGPTEDGGYVLIGLRQFTSKIFQGISWGTGSVLNQTRTRLKRLGWQWHELRQCWDVDRPEDLERLMCEGHLRRYPLNYGLY